MLFFWPERSHISINTVLVGSISFRSSSRPGLSVVGAWHIVIIITRRMWAPVFRFVNSLHSSFPDTCGPRLFQFITTAHARGPPSFAPCLWGNTHHYWTHVGNSFPPFPSTSISHHLRPAMTKLRPLPDRCSRRKRVPEPSEMHVAKLLWDDTAAIACSPTAKPEPCFESCGCVDAIEGQEL